MIKISLILFFLSFLYSDHSLNLISFNIHGFNKNKNAQKISKIIDSVQNFDILSLQENWSYNNLFLDKIKNFKFISDKSKTVFNSTGLSILLNKSIDVIKYEVMNFTHCNGIFFNGNDCLASKGFIFARINLSGNLLDIYNTHLDAGSSKKDQSVRRLQLNELYEYIKNKNSNYPLIITGDFNINYEGSEIKAIQEFINNINLELVKWDEKYFLDYKVDYIFLNNIKNSNKWAINELLYKLSDHPPMSAIIEFK